MASRHYTYAVTVPPTTTQANAVEAVTGFDPGELNEITITSPGVVGTGIAIAFAHQIVIPYSGAQWILSSNASQNFRFTLNGYGTSGAWSVFGYNTTAGAVTWNLVYAVSEPAHGRHPRSPAPTPISARAVYAAAERALTG